MLAAAVASVIIAACNQGPGTSEERGAQGPPGRDGVANIVVVARTIRSADFEVGGASSFAIASYTIPELTRQISERGAVLAYIRGAGYSVWSSLPYSITIVGGGTLLLSHSHSERFFALTIDAAVVTSRTANLFDRDTIRMGLIPPGQGMAALEHVDVTNYSAVSRLLDLIE